ncbi:MAG: MBL fold metallo-hydrolase [Candidatus Bathyarchaeota archaeon B26-2]|nr:MAG: MBL fold metallo-hydrolase [Candidatus Bathyarchaeota archaeon B26-2]
MIVKRFTVGPLGTNCYIVICEDSKEAIVIDPGIHEDEYETVLDRVIRDVKVRYIVNTHGHFDHIMGNRVLKEKTGASIMIHRADRAMLTDPSLNLSWMLGLRIVSPPTDIFLEDGTTFAVGDYRFKVIHTPGHSRGSISILGDGIVFTGDTLFAGSIGRTDLPGSSFNDLIRSLLDRLMRLPDETKVYPGHGPQSLIGVEKQNNPYIRAARI